MTLIIWLSWSSAIEAKHLIPIYNAPAMEFVAGAFLARLNHPHIPPLFDLGQVERFQARCTHFSEQPADAMTDENRQPLFCAKHPRQPVCT